MVDIVIEWPGYFDNTANKFVANRIGFHFVPPAVMLRAGLKN